MSGLGFNKIAGAVLASALAIVGLNEASSMYFEPAEYPHDKWAVPIEAMEGDSGGAAAGPELPIDWGTALPAADLAAGQALFAKCKSCHKVTDENGTGPGLNAIVGRAPASHAGFTKYSDPLKAYVSTAPVWDYDSLNTFLTAPKKAVPGTKMGFSGLKKQQDRINLIAYLRTQGGTLGIPASDPVRVAAIAAAAAGAAAPPAGAPGVPAAEGAPTATGETAQAGQPVQAPASGVAAAPTQVPQAKGADVPAKAPAAPAKAAH